MFPLFILFFGSALTYENTMSKEFKIYEIWLIFYFFWTIISITICFDWKQIVLSFWIVKFNYWIVMNWIYDSLGFQFYIGIAYVCLTYPIISLLITKKILELLKLIQENKQLIEMIKIILKSFPEAVIIQDLNQITKSSTIKFANDVAKSEILTYTDPEECKLDESKLDSEVTLINDDQINDDKGISFSVSSLFSQEANRADIEDNEVINNVMIKQHGVINADDAQCFTVKTMKVNWEHSNNAYMHVFINTTHIKKLANAKATNEWLRVMFSSISHEFRTPINAFSNALSLLESNNDAVDKLVKVQPMSRRSVTEVSKMVDLNRKFLRICDISSKLLLSLTEDILDMAKMEAGIFSLNEAVFMVGSLVTEIKYIFEVQWERKGIRFDVFCETELMATHFNSDMGRIKQVLMNLISNSFKFTDKGGIDLRVRLRHTERGRWLEFTVSDTGTGISSEDAQHLFKMFTVIKKNREFNMRGTGLGLTISKRLVESMGGQINITSEERKGTDAHFTIFEQSRCKLNLNWLFDE